jgi:hypothetical protein
MAVQPSKTCNIEQDNLSFRVLVSHTQKLKPILLTSQESLENYLEEHILILDTFLTLNNCTFYYSY